MENPISVLEQFFVPREEFQTVKNTLREIQSTLSSLKPQNRMVGIEQASAIINHSKSHIYKLRMKKDGIPCHKRPHSKKLLFDVDELHAWMKADEEKKVRIQDKRRNQKRLDST
jgi:hypothetical protein